MSSIGLIEAFLSPRFAAPTQGGSGKSVNATSKGPSKSELVPVSRGFFQPTQSVVPDGSRLIDDQFEETSDGFRRTQEFERQDGSRFSRTEDFLSTQQQHVEFTNAWRFST